MNYQLFAQGLRLIADALELANDQPTPEEIDDNIKSLNERIEKVAPPEPEVPARVKAAAPKPEPDPLDEDEKTEDAPTVTYDELKSLAIKVANSHGRDAAINALYKATGSKLLKGLPEDQYAAAYEALRNV